VQSSLPGSRNLAGRFSSTRIVVFAHIPLWIVYPDCGWGTDDGAHALSYLKRFGSVSILNGHIHEVLQKLEGNVSFHTRCPPRSRKPNQVMRRLPDR
jgi:3',5'-cyclic-AMP phosphodiesterase